VSAVAGLMRLDGEPAASRDLERMANALGAYGPDRTGVALAGPVGFAHVLMRMTPEDRFDRQPLRGNAGELMTADLRLDNRDEILDRLGINGADSLSWPDAQVLFSAWKRFRNDVWRSLRGPFAVAIWNPHDRTLTLARDHLGHNVIMWHKSERFFAFATMPKGLFALADVPREVNEQKIADFLVLNHREHATTFYRGVHRLPPAHVATIDCTGAFAAKEYWSAADSKPVRLPSDQSYAEHLRACLDRAVRRQSRSATPIGCWLSGGLDSSAVAALAAHALGERGERLAAFTAVPRKGFAGQVREWLYADETPYVEAIKAAINNIDVTYVHNDEHDDFADLDRVSLAFEYPVRNPTNLGWMLAILRLARAENRRVMLGGFLGNNTVSWDGWSQASRHLLRGRLRLAYRQYRAFYRISTLSRWIAFRRLFVDSLWSAGQVDWMDWWHGKAFPWLGHSAIRPEFAAEMQVKERARAVGHDFRPRERHWWRRAWLVPVDYLGDWYAATKAMYGVELRDPTADVDVVEYCFGVPDEQYLAEGVDRSLIRRAMWDLLPPVVVANRRMGVQSADWYEKASHQRPQLQSLVDDLANSQLARRALDLDRLQRALDTWPQSNWHTGPIDSEYHLAFTRALGVGRFLRWIDKQNR
jgi:asparagine synthase (glutamine-hydrolysing)